MSLTQEQSRHTIALAGCRVQPLSSYLKSVGIARLVSNQADPTARCYFDGGFVLDTVLDEDGLVQFLLERYEPTPVLNPWNNGTGFGIGGVDSTSAAAKAVRAIENSADVRLRVYRDAIAAARSASERDDWDKLDKGTKVMLLRNALPDEAVEWVDAAVVFTSSSLSFPALLGTGGNDGRLDFGSGFLQRIGELFGAGDKPMKPSVVEGLARDSLFGTNTSTLIKSTPGQFDPAAVGGARSAPKGNADALVNPWDYVLTLEGAIAFASGVARRYGASANTNSIPFTVRPSTVGYGSSADENSRGEFWAPVWTRPASWPELAHTFREGRVEYRGRQARSGVEAALAIANLGVARGIDRFVRYSFVERNGLATFAVPVAELEVRAQPSARLIGELNDWVTRFRGDRVPGTAVGLVRRIQESIMAITQFEGDQEYQQREALFELLYLASQLQDAALRSNSMRDLVQRPPANLPAGDWLDALDDQSDEFEIASSLASWRLPEARFGIIRSAVIADWDGSRADVDGFGRRPLNEVLGEVIGWWSTKVKVERFDIDNPNNAWNGQVTASWCRPDAYAALVDGRVDLGRLEKMLGAMMMLDWRRPRRRRQDAPDAEASAEPEVRTQKYEEGVDEETSAPVAIRVVTLDRPPVLWSVPVWLAAMKVCFSHRPIGRDLTKRPVVGSSVAARNIAAGRLEEALERCMHTLRVAGMQPRFTVSDVSLEHRGADGVPYGIALLTPLSVPAIKRLAHRVTTFEEQNPAAPAKTNATKKNSTKTNSTKTNSTKTNSTKGD